jgi:hypothetical protein
MSKRLSDAWANFWTKMVDANRAFDEATEIAKEESHEVEKAKDQQKDVA